MKSEVVNVDTYISRFPKEVQKLLRQLRKVIKDSAPDAKEVINYGIPTFVLEGNLVHFAAYKHHIGFYPAPSGIKKFEKELSSYKWSKGAVQFPISQPLPLKLVSKVVKFRVAENIEKAAQKSIFRTCGKGHKYYKSSDCPTCPICEKEREPQDNFLSLLSAPARRALEGVSIITVKQLSNFSETELLKLHGLGKTSLFKLKQALELEGLCFKE